MNKFSRSSLFTISIICISLLFSACKEKSEVAEQPNILWITIEDLTPMVGCYGDQSAVTPTIDKLAENGVKYTNAFASAAVCSPARSCLITSLFATTIGTQNLRSETEVPDEIIPFSKLLRKAGYYCANNYKEDYNFTPKDVWDESGKKAHWRKRNENQPFFAVFNFETTHQSKIFGSDSVYENRYKDYINKIIKTDPEKIELPPYSFDTPEIRKLWARYYDNVQIVDLQIKALLEELKADGLAENTIIFFFSDHGTGMPRGKRALYDSGLKVPLIISAPEKYQEQLGLIPGTDEDRLVSFLDFGPTVLNLLNIEIPEVMDGIPFLGKNSEKENEFVFATSDRVDEAFEIVRSVRTKKFRFVRNFLPHLPLIQPNYYSDKSEISKANKKLRASEIEMTAAQKSMWLPKRPIEELYDIENDPFETVNLAQNPDYENTLQKLRKENRNMIIKTRDSGLMPEAYMYSISEGSTPYQVLKDNSKFPLDSILLVQDELNFGNPDDQKIDFYLNHPHPLIQYWTMIWMQNQEKIAATHVQSLQELTGSDAKTLSITAAETLCKFGYFDKGLDIILEGLEMEDSPELLMSARAFELLENKPESAMQKAEKSWERLRKATEGKWKGYDLYAFWSLSQVFGN